MAQILAHSPSPHFISPHLDEGSVPPPPPSPPPESAVHPATSSAKHSTTRPPQSDFFASFRSILFSKAIKPRVFARFVRLKMGFLPKSTPARSLSFIWPGGSWGGCHRTLVSLHPSRESFLFEKVLLHKYGLGYGRGIGNGDIRDRQMWGAAAGSEGDLISDGRGSFELVNFSPAGRVQL